MATAIGTLRETLINAIEQVKSGSMDTNKANAIAKLASAVTANLQVELNAMEILKNLKTGGQVGTLMIGGETIANKNYEDEKYKVLPTGVKTVEGNVTTHRMK